MEPPPSSMDNPMTTAIRISVGTTQGEGLGQTGHPCNKINPILIQDNRRRVTRAAATAATSAVRRPLADANQTPDGAAR